jgi:hypothetical protein
VPDQALQLANAHALGNAMLVLLLAPWGFDFIFYCGARQLPFSAALSGQPFIVCIEGLPIVTMVWHCHVKFPPWWAQGRCKSCIFFAVICSACWCFACLYLSLYFCTGLLDHIAFPSSTEEPSH